MVDPAGRFYDNSKGKHTYSRPILEIGSRLAIQQVRYDYIKFVARGGVYNWEVEKKSKANKITISGEVASGKSTIGKLLAKELNYSFTSIGQRTRMCAEELGISIVEFQQQCLNNPHKDKEIDLQFSGECNAMTNVVIDYRLGYKFIDKGFHVFLKIRESTAIERLKSAQRYNETHETIKERNDTFKNQFLNAYGIDYCNEDNYDLVINVEEYSSPAAIVNEIIDTLKILVTPRSPEKTQGALAEKHMSRQ